LEDFFLVFFDFLGDFGVLLFDLFFFFGSPGGPEDLLRAFFLISLSDDLLNLIFSFLDFGDFPFFSEDSTSVFLRETKEDLRGFFSFSLELSSDVESETAVVWIGAIRGFFPFLSTLFTEVGSGAATV
jgi:hypothetical protein